MPRTKTTNSTPLPGTGLLKRSIQASEPRILGIASADLAPVDWPTGSNNPLPPDEDQDGSASCTAQAAGYALFNKARTQLTRRDVYSQTFLPGGGAYLTAPFEFLNKHGLVLRQHFPDPELETETIMESPLMVGNTVLTDDKRNKWFEVKTTVVTVLTIEAAAKVIEQYGFVILGVHGSWTKGWEKSWLDPYFGQVPDWNHALFGANFKMRNGKKAIECKSSWCQHRDFLGQASRAHYINEDYFNTGGVFEILAVEIKEITMDSKFTVLLPNGSYAVLEITPQGFISGKVARNEADYQDLGLQLGLPTCTKRGKIWNFSPTDLIPKP